MKYPDLPSEIKLKISENLDLKSLGRVSKTNQESRSLNSDEIMWRNRYNQISRGFDPSLIPTALAETWLEKFQFMLSLLNPFNSYTFIDWTTLENGQALGEHITVLRNVIAKSADQAWKCVFEVYRNKIEPIYSFFNRFEYNPTRNQLDRSSDVVKRMFFNPYFELNYNDSTDYHSSLTLFKIIPHYYGYRRDPSVAILSIPGSNFNRMYDLLAFLLNNSTFFLGVFDPAQAIHNSLYEFLRNKESFMRINRKFTGTNFTGPKVEKLFRILQTQGRDTYVIIPGPLRWCPPKTQQVYKSHAFYSPIQPVLLPSPTIVPTSKLSVHSRALPLPSPDFFQVQRGLPQVPLFPPPLIPPNLPRAPSPRPRLIPRNLPPPPTFPRF